MGLSLIRLVKWERPTLSVGSIVICSPVQGKSFCFVPACCPVLPVCPIVATAATTDIPAQLLLPSNMNRRPVSLQSQTGLLMCLEQLPDS